MPDDVAAINGRQNGRRAWTAQERLLVQELIEYGQPLEAIAHRLGRTRTAIEVYAKRNLRRRALRPHSARDIARMLGLGCAKTVARWVRAGWLRGQRRMGAGPSCRVAVLQDDLLTFLENPEHWHRWNPERILDSALREYVIEMRAERYLTPGQVAQRLYVQHGTVNAWIRRGLLPARRWGNWWVRERDLEGFVPPYARERRGRPQRRFTPTEDALLVELRAAGLTLTAIGARLGRDLGSVAGRVRRLADAPKAASQATRTVAA